MMDKPFVDISDFRVLVPSMEEALKQYFDKFKYKNSLHVNEGECSVQKKLHFELNRIIKSHINNLKHHSLLDFRIDSNTSTRGETSLRVVPNNLFTLILIFFYEVPNPMFLPNSGTFKNEERFDYKEHSFWFEDGEPRAININVDKCKTSINRFSL